MTASRFHFLFQTFRAQEKSYESSSSPRRGTLSSSTLGRFLLSLLLFTVFMGGTLSAQTAMKGTVTDPSGAAVSHARVTVTDYATHTEQHTSTDGGGTYALPALPAGRYTVTVQALGFAPFHAETLSIPTGDAPPVTLDMKLQLESATQSVTVQGNGELLQETPSIGKTSTKLENLPMSVQVIRRELVNAQGGLSLADTIRNSSGVEQGGTDGFGFGDRFQIRGLEARIYNDGFSDGDERNGIPHSLNGVERVEILEGPGSALFGTGPPGGTINVVHFSPAPERSYGGVFQTGSFGLVSGNAFVTGTTGLSHLNYRVDGLAQHINGFRSLPGADYELRPVFTWTGARHVTQFASDARYLQARPDPAGLIYVNGQPITGVSREAKYSTPFSFANQTMDRETLSDVWQAAPYVTVTNRFSYMYRNFSVLRNGDGGTVVGTAFNGRQLRSQHDTLNDFDYEAEPVWSFRTGSIRHNLLTGFEVQHQSVVANRATADLPNISNIFAPVVPETSTAGLQFQRNAKHSGFLDDLRATYLGFYATDQIDVTDRLNVRIGGRQDVWKTELLPQVFVDGRILQGTQLIEPPFTYPRTDTPFSWNAGMTYRLFRGVTPFFGVARSNLVNFTSEATQSGVQGPESGLQYEAGLKVSGFSDRLMLTGAAFDVKRNNVFTLVGDVPNFSDQKTQGGEANLQLQVSRRWKLIANGTGMHPILTDNPSNTAGNGKRPIGVPEHIFNLWTSYDLHLHALKGLTVSGGLTNRDRMYANVTNTTFVPGYTTLDAVLSYNAHAWNGSLGFRNLTDTRYFTAANGGGGFVGTPRSFFVSLRRAWGSRE